MKRVTIIPREILDVGCLAVINDRVAAPEHRLDNGPCQVWNMPSYASKIDSRWRRQGYGSAAIDAFAELLKRQDVTGVGGILVDTFGGQYQEASERLVARLKAKLNLPPADRTFMLRRLLGPG